MPLTQARMDAMADRLMHTVEGRCELVTYRARATLSATPGDHPGLRVAVEHYSDHAIAMAGLTADGRPTVLREDRRFRLPTATVTWTPTLADEVVRSDGSHWRVLSIAGGPGNPFYLLQGRKIS